jgi:hypothetical protein
MARFLRRRIPSTAPSLANLRGCSELFQLVGDTRSEMEAAWRFVRSGALVLGTIEHAELQHVRGLMSFVFSLDFPICCSGDPIRKRC